VCLLAPDGASNLIVRHDLASSAGEQGENGRGLRLQANDRVVATQFALDTSNVQPEMKR
jgi:hypothetical protein